MYVLYTFSFRVSNSLLFLFVKFNSDMTLVTKQFFPSHRQFSKGALFILIYDSDLSSGCTLHAEKRLCISFDIMKLCLVSMEHK